MPKFQLIALFITLIGVASGFQWCDQMRSKLTDSNDKMEITWIIEDLLNYLVGNRLFGRAIEVQSSLNLLISADEMVKGAKEKAKENVREIAKASLKDCDTISEQSKMEIEKQLTKAGSRIGLFDVMEKIARFLEIHGESKAATQARKDMMTLCNKKKMFFFEAKNLAQSHFKRLEL
ncbi:uncharacterized protein LOC141856818 [Brevipalpus obovatus]|uniref:uncharacterized protein LOC141856818 n=1 Tax=Brevipalpus obovatus TaxID=246614 RepID=UPI003D9E4C67